MLYLNDGNAPSFISLLYELLGLLLPYESICSIPIKVEYQGDQIE